MDFALLPPEINSGLMYSGVGPGPMIAASSAWHSLAAELSLAASAYSAEIADLRSGWHGPSGMAMAAAATPYVTWMENTAVFAEHTGHQLAASVAAYEAAFAATVPPPVIVANRTLLATLIATNFLGINTPAIAATEAHYDAMWAQDAAAMYTYAGTTAATTRLAPFAQPPKVAHESGAEMSMASAAHAVASSVVGHAAEISHTTLEAIPQTLSHFSTGMMGHASAGTLSHAPADLVATHASGGLIGYTTSPMGLAHAATAAHLGQAAVATGAGNAPTSGAVNGFAGLTDSVLGGWKRILSYIHITESPYGYQGYIGNWGLAWLHGTNINGLVNQGVAIAKMLEGPKLATGTFGPQTQALTASSTTQPLAGSAHVISAASGRAASIGSLSVPSKWATATGAHLTSTTSSLAPMEVSINAASAAPSVASNESLSMFSQMVMASLMGRGVGGQAVSMATQTNPTIGKAPDVEELTTSTILVIPEEAEAEAELAVN